MQPKSSKWLNDILEACDFILRYTVSRTLAGYEQDEVLSSAVDRRFEIIGEALRRIKRVMLHGSPTTEPSSTSGTFSLMATTW